MRGGFARANEGRTMNLAEQKPHHIFASFTTESYYKSAHSFATLNTKNGSILNHQLIDYHPSKCDRENLTCKFHKMVNLLSSRHSIEEHDQL